MKKAVLILLSVILLFSLGSCKNETVAPDESETNTDSVGSGSAESPAKDFEYEISSKGDAVYITKYIGTSKQVVIPEKLNDLPVVSLKGVCETETVEWEETIDEYSYIREGVFENSEIESVEIPSSVTAIGVYAFRNCKNLVTCRFAPYSRLNRILDGAFEGCTNLKAIDLPDTVTEITQYAFRECSSLKKMDLPKNLSVLGKGALENCRSLKSITIPAGLEFSGLYVRFTGNSALEQIVFEEGREKISGYDIFNISSTAKVKITIPKSVKEFTPYIFFIYSPADLIFEGDCPQLPDSETERFAGEPTVYYDPQTNGWDECDWQDMYGITVKPLEKE